VEKRHFKSNYNPFIPVRNYKNFITAYLSAKLLKTNLNLSCTLKKTKFCDKVKFSFVPFSFAFVLNQTFRYLRLSFVRFS